MLPSAPSVYQQRARLLTALIDGAAMQIHVGPQASYLQSVVDTAMKIALPALLPERVNERPA